MVTTHEHETTQRARNLYARAEQSSLDYWADRARNEVYWDTPFTEVLDWSNPPFAKWFADGTTNACYNSVDRHVEAGNGDRVALYFEGEPGDTEPSHDHVGRGPVTQPVGSRHPVLGHCPDTHSA